MVTAHALGLPIERVSIEGASTEDGRDLEGHTLVRWDLLLGQRDDMELCRDAMTTAYAGMAWECISSGGSFNDVYETLPTDSGAVAWIRKCFIERGTLDFARSREVSLAACNRAFEMVAQGQDEIRDFAERLVVKKFANGRDIDDWYRTPPADDTN